MPLSRRRASAPERVPEPQAERALVLANITSGGDGFGEVGGGIHTLEDCLPGNACRLSGLPQRASLGELLQDHLAAPVEVHGVRLSVIR